MSFSSQGGGDRNSQTLHILQLTDLHLYADPEGRLLGQNTRRTLQSVLELACRSLQPIDLLLLTGDLVHDGSSEGYGFLQQLLATLGAPCYCLPGNHDNAGILSEIADGELASSGLALHTGRWNLVLLNSTIPGENGGYLDAGQLALLEESLAARADDPALVCLHHQPVRVGSAWMDTMALGNPDDFFRIIDRHEQVRGVLWGHIHQEFSGVRNGVMLLASPSTCVQFLPGSADFALDELTPGFRWLKLHPDGRIETGVQRVSAYPDPLVLSKEGY